MTETPRIHPLLNGLVDYAGLFPPAALAFGDAVVEYAKHQRGDDAAMLARFICPADRTEELHPFAERFDPDHPLRLSLLVGPITGRAEEIPAALKRSRSFRSDFGGSARVELVECSLPPDLRGSAVRALLCHAADTAAPLPVYVEIPVARRPDEALAALAEFGPARRSGRVNLGAKIRCGGAEAADYPSTGNVARFVHRCITDGVPFKGTAGLHHPVRGHPSVEGPAMHGFLNLFGAAVLCATRDLDTATLETILADTDPTAFSLADGRFAWADLVAPLPAVQAVRTGLATGFGSCSFEEPTDGLRALGWLQPYS